MAYANTSFITKDMPLKTNKNSFTRFLKEEKFIAWKLFPTDELVSYWENFRQTHPDEQEDIILAEEHFQNIQLSSYKAAAVMPCVQQRATSNHATTLLQE